MLSAETVRQIQLEEEARPPTDPRLHLQLRLHRARQLAADREAESRLREELTAAPRFLAQRQERRRDLLGRYAAAGVTHRELDAIPLPDFLCDDLDVALVGKLERVRRQIEEDAAERDRMSEPLVVDRGEETHGEMLLSGDGPRDVAHRSEHRRHRERRRLLIHELIAALRELDDVARDGRKTERRGIDEPELAALDVVHLAALAALQRLGEHQD